MSCKTMDACDDTCPVYDLCEVTVSGGECVPNGETRIICEGFKFTSKLDSEVKTNSACYEGYGYQVSNLQYEWEITNPCDRDWFDKRFVAQLCDKYSMQITGYVQTDCGEWTKKETLTACLIDETGREYGKGVTRSIKGKALHRIIHNGKEDKQGNTYNASRTYKNNLQKDPITIRLLNQDLNSSDFQQIYKNLFLGSHNLGGFGTPQWFLQEGFDFANYEGKQLRSLFSSGNGGGAF